MSAGALAFSAGNYVSLLDLNTKQETEKRKIESLKTEAMKNEAKAIVATNARIANIINYQMEQGQLKDLTPGLVQKTLDLVKEFETDSLDDKFYASINAVGFSDEVVRTEFGYRVRNKWSIYAQPGSPFYDEFPAGTAMVYHNESIPYIACEDAGNPQIHFAPMSATNNQFDAQFIADDTTKAYRIEFTGTFDPIKDRLILKIFCPATVAEK